MKKKIVYEREEEKNLNDEKKIQFMFGEAKSAQLSICHLANNWTQRISIDRHEISKISGFVRDKSWIFVDSKKSI